MNKFLRSVMHRDLCLKLTTDLVDELKTAYMLGLREKYITATTHKYQHIKSLRGSSKASIRLDFQQGNFKFNARKSAGDTWLITMWEL